MADKPRVKAPKQRVATADETARRRKTWAIVAAVAGLVLGLVAVGALLGVGGGGGPSPAELRMKVEAAGCTFQVAPALAGAHSIDDSAGTSSRWNTNPPTSGPHYGIAAIFGIYEDQLELDHLLHAAPALDERGAYGEEDGNRPDREADEESDDDHGADRR